MIINDENLSNEYNDKCKEYMNYIDTHINNAKLAFKKLFIDRQLDWSKLGITRERLIPILKQVYQDVQHHDESKYTDEEFDGYREKWFPTREEKDRYDKDLEYAKEVDANADDAWKHHYRYNDHHPRHWCSIDDSDNIVDKRDMSIVAILHMLCDWEAMSMYLNPKNDLATVSWYINNATHEKDEMTGNTRKVVESLLELIYDTGIPKEEDNKEVIDNGKISV